MKFLNETGLLEVKNRGSTQKLIFDIKACNLVINSFSFLSEISILSISCIIINNLFPKKLSLVKSLSSSQML